jgi:hypothetical protein
MPNTAFLRPELFESLGQLKCHRSRERFAKNKER